MSSLDPPAPPEGIFFDEVSKVRVLDPESSQQTHELKEECTEFLQRMDAFQGSIGTFIQMIERLSTAVEAEKIKAIAARNTKESASKTREGQQQQYLALIAEKKAQLERLQVEQTSLERAIQEQEGFIDDLVTAK
eukprot:m.4803 g.4803  ORF g.4803 m.4803 type:complete len:135 (+) comp7200_c0_seq1:63-467(+)